MMQPTVRVDAVAPMTWIDLGVVPPRRLPAGPDAIAAYLAEVLGHPVYERWTWTRLIKAYGALPDARRVKPTVCRLLIDVPEVVEAWRRGRLRAMPASEAPPIDAVVMALLKSHAGRFKATQTAAAVIASSPLRHGAAGDRADVAALAPDDALPDNMVEWLRRRGRLVNLHADTNTLGATDDHAAAAAFLRERATRSPHTWRAYTAELQRLVAWCSVQGLGPLSDLTRQDLLAYRQGLARPGAGATAAIGTDEQALHVMSSQRSQARALAVVASLFRYWHDTGYLLGNPAAGLGGGARSRATFDSQRFVPESLLTTCDDWLARSVACLVPAPEHIAAWRRAAIWTLFRFGGLRLAELAWQPALGLPRLEVDDRGQLTLHVSGKGSKARSIPLPRRCADVLRDYRLARGLRPRPKTLEHLPLIHGERAPALGARGLYDQVKAVLLAVAEEVHDDDDRLLLREVSPHWLRHAYARSLVVDQAVPLPAAQALLGHASVQTTAEYAKTDLSTLRAFVEKGFSGGAA